MVTLGPVGTGHLPASRGAEQKGCNKAITEDTQPVTEWVVGCPGLDGILGVMKKSQEAWVSCFLEEPRKKTDLDDPWVP